MCTREVIHCGPRWVFCERSQSTCDMNSKRSFQPRRTSKGVPTASSLAGAPPPGPWEPEQEQGPGSGRLGTCSLGSLTGPSAPRATLSSEALAHRGGACPDPFPGATARPHQGHWSSARLPALSAACCVSC